jgi:hypothetical protein
LRRETATTVPNFRGRGGGVESGWRIALWRGMCQLDAKMETDEISDEVYELMYAWSLWACFNAFYQGWLETLLEERRHWLEK